MQFISETQEYNGTKIFNQLESYIELVQVKYSVEHTKY